MGEAFKNWLSEAAVSRVAGHITRVWPAFPRSDFEAAVLPGLAALELKARVVHVARGLRPFLPADFPEAADILVRSLGPEAPMEGFEAEHGDGNRGMAVWSLTRFVSEFGLLHFEASMAALDAMTRRLTAEFDIRPFLTHHPEATWARLHQWAESPNPHLRRLCSEGTRSRLPWGTRVPGLIEDPHRGLALVEKLKDDAELYVRRSVANHLNDVSKDHPELALEVGRRWLHQASDERAWIVRHALRSRLKAADPAALSLFEYPPVEVVVEHFSVAPSVAFTGALPYALVLRGDGPVLIDEVVHYMKARGTTSPKVFRIADRVLTPGQAVRYDRVIDFKPITTRKHYPGRHRLDIRVNGVVVAGEDFVLEAP